MYIYIYNHTLYLFAIIYCKIIFYVYRGFKETSSREVCSWSETIKQSLGVGAGEPAPFFTPWAGRDTLSRIYSY